MRPASGPPPGRPVARGPTYREFLQIAVGVMLVLGGEVLVSFTAAQAGSPSHGVASPGPVPTEAEVPPTPPRSGQVDAPNRQRWSFAAAIASAERTLAAAGRWAEPVDGAWHALAWPLPSVTTSLADTVNPPPGGDMLIELGPPCRTVETVGPWLQGPASLRRVQAVSGVEYVAPRIAARPWLVAHVNHSEAGPRGPPRRRHRHA